MFDHATAEATHDIATPSIPPTNVPAQKEVILCPNCSKSMTSKSGLTLHLKKCSIEKCSGVKPLAMNTQTAVRPEFKQTDIDPRDVEFDDYHPEERVEEPMHNDRHHQRKKGATAQNPFSGLGAFAIMADHVPLYLDITFAITLGEEILARGSTNKAIMAFAHQLKNLGYDDT